MNYFQDQDYWRAIILYGLNTATYKIALGKALAQFARHDETNVSMSSLAEAFFDLYRERLENGMPQLSLPNRLTVMERIVAEFNLKKLSRSQAIGKVEKHAFNDVIPRFHTVNNDVLPVQFYEVTDSGLVLTDNLFEIFTSPNIGETLDEELSSRWDLLEAAFVQRREGNNLINDVRRIYLEKGYDRTDITGTIPVLNGYQEGICFYCGEEIGQGSKIHVDHVIPRQFINHDEIWNLVLAHDFCNMQKSDALPGQQYINKLISRNEHLIASNHPIKNTLIKTMGRTPKQRHNCVIETYKDAKFVLGCTWEGVRGYNPATDEFYKSFIRRHINA